MSHLVIGAMAFLVLAPRPAQADAFFGPWIGATFARSEDIRSGDNGSTSFGAILGNSGGETIGYDIDFGYTSKFFGPTGDIGNNRLITIMGNVVIGPSISLGGGRDVRPFAAFGIGLIRSQAEGGSLFTSGVAENDFGWNGAGGLMAFLSSHVGVRGEVRYFHTVNNTDATNTILLKPGTFHFWRGAIGVVFR